MKQRTWYFIVLLLVILLVLASVPRVSDVQHESITKINEYPVLHESYRDLCSQYSLYNIISDDTFYIVTVRNIWGNWERYILPCFAAKTPDIPRAGNADFTAFMHVLSPWEEENLFMKLCPLKMERFFVSMKPGDNAMVYQLAEVLPMGVNVNSNEFGLRAKQNCDKEPSVFVYYTMATLNGAQQRNQLVVSEFSWSYHLRMCGNEFAPGTFTLSKEHTVNA